MMEDDYKGIRVGVELRLGERLPEADPDLAVALLLLLELKGRDPKVFRAAMLAINAMDEVSTNGR